MNFNTTHDVDVNIRSSSQHLIFFTFANVDLAAPKVRIKVETALAVEKIESVAFSDGLQPEQLLNLVKLGTSGKYGESKCQMTSDVGRDVALMLLITHVTFNFNSLSLLLNQDFENDPQKNGQPPHHR